jgi:hypothetical protein
LCPTDAPKPVTRDELEFHIQELYQRLDALERRQMMANSRLWYWPHCAMSCSDNISALDLSRRFDWAAMPPALTA